MWQIVCSFVVMIETASSRAGQPLNTLKKCASRYSEEIGLTRTFETEWLKKEFDFHF